MTSSVLPEQLVPYEVFSDYSLLSGTPLVAHLSGRRFEQRLNERSTEVYDGDFQKALLKVLSHLCAVLGCSFGYADRTDLLLYAVSQGSDARRLMTRLAAESSAKLSLLVNDLYTFDVRLFEIPHTDMAHQYFIWRRELAESSAQVRYLAHRLTAQGGTAQQAQALLDAATPAQRLEVLRRHGIEWSTLPIWQRHGATVYTAQDDVRGPHLVIDLRLPERDRFPEYLARHIV
jgi:tRNA(His) 5'-end guanylyltransferase